MPNITVVEQCIKWNAKRYDRVYNDDLTVSLLLEESEELKNSVTLVDILDACGDITFVSVGALWKLGFSQKLIEKLFLHSQIDGKAIWEVTGILINASDCLLGSTILKLPHNKAALQDKVGYILGHILAVLTQLDKLDLQHEFIAIFKAIADSNDTKEIKGKTESHIKANVVKGNKYVPPTKELIRILKQNGKENANVV